MRLQLGFDGLSAVKKILKSDGAKAVISFVAAGYIWLVYRTSRWQVINGDAPHRLMAEKKPFILAFWHGRLLMMPISVKKSTKVHVMISYHGDGEIIARTIKHWGQNSVRGSATKGAAAAFKQMMKVLRAGEVAVITPDGPRGPRMRAQEGVVRLAAMSGMPVFPVSFSTTRGKLLGSWDRFFVAGPFSRGVVTWGDGIFVPKRDEGGAFEKSLMEIENSLIAITQNADELCGRETVQPESRDKPVKPHKKQVEA
ncbi:lysophospholipid acyltransferase family protein [Sneathiella marina]|uniref:Lysophospholipid acyltransferase family protein n=1 Tax=Sneathiella marina TaxID=2950108 RepID=A0ABY4W011_9PROT|nr:lysophospholipid acyltransferase family protein [Sneathiella marina]USG60211.1 lysophospholipid acyltransferase family protein [Sneathiella marina]